LFWFKSRSGNHPSLCGREAALSYGWQASQETLIIRLKSSQSPTKLAFVARALIRAWPQLAASG
jgi:hypothetical protein